jgi:nitroimidazol reductase NimA-like FMN-containing flavoprotein (pyridoxamine 5'-phosphate oxidase superfamily)
MARIEPTPRTTVRRKPGRGAYDRDVIEAILDEGFLCNVAVVVDGRPLVIPTGYARDGERLYLHGARNNAMLRAMLQGEACISVTLLDGLVLARSVMHHSMNYRSVVLFGRGEEVVGREEKFAAMRSIVEHIIPGRWEDARLPTDAEVEATLVVRFPINECSAKIRTGPPIDDEDDMPLPVWAGVLPAPSAWQAPEPDPQLPAGVPAPGYLVHYARPTRKER